MSNVARQTVVRLKDFRASDVGDRVSNALDTFTGQIAGGVQSLGSKARSAVSSTDGFVRSSPWQAVGAVALAGLAAGMLVSLTTRRARRRARDAARDASSEMAGG